jgi:hypothetical protein
MVKVRVMLNSYALGVTVQSSGCAWALLDGPINTKQQITAQRE